MNECAASVGEERGAGMAAAFRVYPRWVDREFQAPSDARLVRWTEMGRVSVRFHLLFHVSRETPHHLLLARAAVSPLVPHPTLLRAGQSQQPRGNARAPRDVTGAR